MAGPIHNDRMTMDQGRPPGRAWACAHAFPLRGFNRRKTAKPRRISGRLRAAAKGAFFLIYVYAYAPIRDLVLACLGRSRTVVVYYHRVGGRGLLSRSLDDFQRDLRYLARRYECINFGELCQRLRSGRKFRRRSAVVTFDDGYMDNYTAAAPELISAGIPATFFVATGFIGTQRAFPHDARQGDAEPTRHPKLTWHELGEMQELGFEIGSHTVNHADLGQADESTARHEVRRSLEDLNHHLGERPRALSFPWGKPDNVSETSLVAAREAGYYAAAGTTFGSNGRGEEWPVLHRVDLGNGHLGRLAMRARLAGMDGERVKIARRRGAANAAWEVNHKGERR